MLLYIDKYICWELGITDQDIADWELSWEVDLVRSELPSLFAP